MTSIPSDRHNGNGDTLDEPMTKTETLPRFPNWLRQLVGFGGIVVTVTIAYANIKSDVRDQNTRLEQQVERAKDDNARTEKIEGRVNQMVDDVASIKADMRYVRRVLEPKENRP